jgi:hypothetical protein
MPKINIHDGLLIAATKQTDISKLRTYVYNLNFQCLAGDIEEADQCFIDNTQLSFGEKHKPAWMCPNVSREILLPPMEAAELRRNHARIVTRENPPFVLNDDCSLGEGSQP